MINVFNFNGDESLGKIKLEKKMFQSSSEEEKPKGVFSLLALCACCCSDL